MIRHTAPSTIDTRAIASASAAFAAGLILGVRPRHSSRARTLATIGSLALVALAAIKPSGDAVRRAGTRRRTGRVRFSLLIPRPVEQVFSLCADFENFPLFIPTLTRVVDYGDGRSRWHATTPGGGTIEWDTVTTKFVTNTVIGWKSVPTAPVRMTGLLRFEHEGEGTCLRIALEYQVASSSLRDALAALLSPSNGPRLEREMRRLAERMADAPAALVKELPAVVSAETETQRAYEGAEVTG